MLNIPAVKVEIEVDPSALLQPFFTLDDPTLGELDGDFGLGGLTYADVSEYIQGVTVSRGKRNELEQYDAGNASVTFDNTQRIFDPLGTSPFSQQLLPRRGIRIYSADVPIFFGLVEDWNLNYDRGGNSQAVAIATDGFLLLANQELPQITNSIQNSGDRVNAILSRPEVKWPLTERQIDTGAVTLQADTIDDNTNVLNYLKTISESESGSIFISKDGKVTFQNKLTGPNGSNLICFCDDGTNIPFQDIQVVYGGEFLYNRIVIERKGGTAQVTEDIPSQNFFGVSTLSQSELLMNTDLEAATKAGSLLARYKQPAYRFESITTDLNTISSSQALEILSRELTDVIEVKFTPNGIGDRIIKFGQIIGIEHQITRSGNHKVTFSLETLDFAPIVLDDVIFGVLEDYGLG
jgi:hypothetical protein